MKTREFFVNQGKKLGLTGMALLAFANQAMAALPAEATAAFTELSGNGSDILAAVWPIVTLITGGFILIKLFKKGANKAT